MSKRFNRPDVCRVSRPPRAYSVKAARVTSSSGASTPIADCETVKDPPDYRTQATPLTAFVFTNAIVARQTPVDGW
jgi:hypothetical protein